MPDKRGFKDRYGSNSGKTTTTGIEFTDPRSKYRFNGKNGGVKVVKPADPEKLAAYRATKKSA